MDFATLKKIILRLFNNYVKKYFFKIFIALLLSLIVAGSTASIAWLLDPAVKKIFIDQDKSYAYLIPIAIIIAFSAKGLSLFFARTNVIKVGYWVCAEMQKQMSDKIILSDTTTVENKLSAKFVLSQTLELKIFLIIIPEDILSDNSYTNPISPLNPLEL